MTEIQPPFHCRPQLNYLEKMKELMKETISKIVPFSQGAEKNIFMNITSVLKEKTEPTFFWRCGDWNGCQIINHIIKLSPFFGVPLQYWNTVFY